MDEPPPGDPYTWDVTLLTQELCGNPRPWAPPNSQKRPDAATLSAALQEHEMDGETLLSWEDVFGSHTDLFRDLGITKAAHRMTLAKAIQHLKKRSPLYRQAKQQMLAEEGDDEKDIELPDAKPIVDTTVLPVPNQPDVQETPQPKPEAIHTAVVPTLEAPLAQVAAVGDSEPPSKKRRLAPQLVTSEVRDVGRVPIPTAANSVTLTAAYGPAMFENDSKNVYLGKGALVLADWVPETSLKSTYSEKSGKESEVFVWNRKNKFIAPGRQLQVNRGMMRLLQANSRVEQMLRDNIAPFVDRSPSPESSSDDKVLPCFGDSDDDGYDSATIKEMELEAAEKHVETGMLDKIQVQAILDDVIDKYIQRWRDEKLERLEHKAYPMWRQAQLKGRNHEIARSVKRASDLDVRLKSLVAEIHSQDWPTEGPLRRQARCLEASVEDRQKELWLVEMLTGREPSRKPAAPRPRQKRRYVRADLSDDDGEFLTSDSDQTDDEEPAPAPEPRSPTRRPTPSPPPLMPDGPSPSPAPVTPKRPSPSTTPEDVVDLTVVDEMDTDSDLSDSSSRSSRIVVDLITPDPDRVTDHMPPEELFILTRQQRQIPFDRPHEIGEINLMAWVQSKDPLRLTISYLAKSKASWKFKLLRLVRRKEPDELWNDHILPACNPATPYKPGSSAKGDLAIKFVRLFWQHVSCTLTAAIFTRVLSKRMMEEVPLKRDQFDEFIDFLKRHVIPYMDSEGPAKRVSNIFTAPAEHDEDVKPEVQAGEDVTMDSDKTDSDDEADSGDQVEDGGAYLSSGKNRKRVRPVVRDAAAEKLREDVNDRVKAQERRTNQLRERLAKSETITKEQARLIINTSKEGDDDSAFISVSTKSDHGRPSIADRIKDHQIDGVRFMWNHLTANQGCLLAHTMGLGKTMQVITVLVAIREAAISPKPAINSQIPEDLRGTTRILILCPAGLVDNWIEELAIWAPDDVFTPGESIRHVDPDTPVDDRGKLINAWAEVGGILVIGYDLFRIIHEGSEELGEHLTSGPDIVIADESHRLKNRATKLATITATFRTMRRVALSGTPLANNIGEYYSAMEWIAPNFLGPFKEFTAVYVEPIETGLFAESSGPEFRRAKKMLAALEKTVAPKTHRLTMACLKEQLPSKMEFVITMPMTPLQVSLYKLYIASLSSVAGDDGVKSNSTVFAVATNLALICSHPKCFHQRLVHQRQKREAHRIGVEPDTDSTLTPIFVSEALRLFSRQKDVASMQHSWKVLHLIKILDECRKTKEKVLIFSQSLPTLDFLENLLRQQGRSMVKLTGSTESKARQTMVRDFNFSDTQEVFLISTTAGGIGLNITGASRVVIFDVKYNPVTELQAIGRAYRMGQKRNVVVYRFLKAGTYEKHIYNKHVFKTQLASRVVDKENPKRSSSKFGDLIRPLDEDVPFEDLSEHVGRDGILDAMLAQQAQQKSINSILTADTFDEEDPDDTALSAEERKEVESMIEMNRIRHTDPARFALLEQQMSMQRAAEQHRMMAESASRQKAERADAANSYNVQRAAEQQRLMADAASRHGTHNVPRPPVGPFRPYNPATQTTATQTTATNAQSTATAGLPPVGPQIPPLLAPQPASQTAPGSTSQTGAQSVVQRPLIVHQYNPPGVPGAGPLAAPNGSQGATHSASQPVPQVPQLAHQPVSRGSPQVGGPSSQQAAPKNVPPVAAPAAPQTAHRSTPEGRVVLEGPRRTMPSFAPQKTPSAAPRTPSTSGQAPTATPNMPLSEGVPGGKGSRVMDSTPASPPTRDARLKRQMGIFAKKVYQGTVFDKQNKGEMSDAPDVIIGKATAIGEAVRTIQIERNGGFLPDTNRWNQLLDLADVPLFCGDITEGRLSVLNLVDGDLSKYMPGQIQKHGAASAAKASPATSAMGKDNSKDPNHLSKALSRTDPPASSPGTPSSSRAQEDMIALRKVADRRKNRPLPPWANNALEDAK